MSYIDKNLLADEHITYRTKKNYIIFLIPVAWALAAVSCLYQANPYIIKAAILPGIAALLTFLQQGLTYITSEFIVTNKRIILTEGFFIRHTNETRLSTIANIGISQSLLGRLLNYGTMTINTFGSTNDTFTEIDAPYRFQRETQLELDKLTRR